MPETSVLIVSPHVDFAQSLAEQVKAELGFPCAVAPDFAGVDASVVVTTEAVPTLSCPVVQVRDVPVKMLGLLYDIAQALKGAEELGLPEGYMLKTRTKQLTREGVNVDLTDKEVAIIQCLSSAGAEGLSKEQLLKKIWGFDSSLDTHTLETHIYRLRAKMRELGPEGEGLIAATTGGYAMG